MTKANEVMIPAGTPLATRAVQAGDTNRIVRWGDHSMTGSAPSPGVQVPASPSRPPPGAFQGLFKLFDR